MDYVMEEMQDSLTEGNKRPGRAYNRVTVGLQ